MENIMGKPEKIISIIQIVSAAVWLACVIFDIVYKQANAAEFATYSAPWYASILLYTAVAGVVQIICGVAKLVIAIRQNPEQ